MSRATASPTRVGWRARITDPMVSAVVALGITQITAWGTSYYCLGVLAGPITRDTGWSRGFVFLGFTVALLVMGLVSNAVGRAIDRHGGRAVMTLGTMLVSAGLFALAHVRSEPAYLAVWAFLGLGMRLCLYDAAFAALVQVAPSRGRKAISYLTLFGAFASSVFWVVGHALNDQVGWRQTLVLFALINLVVCLPLHWLGLARRETAEAAARQHGLARPFWDFHALCADPQIDIVDCGTRPRLRQQMVAAALAGGKHVVNQIPFAVSLEAAGGCGRRWLKDTV